MNIWRAVACDSTRPVGLLLALNALGFGIQLAIWPDPLRGSAVLVAMKDLAPAALWSGLFVACAGLELASIAVSRRRPRMLAAFVLVMLWSFLAAAGWYTAPHTIAPTTWTTLAAASVWVLVRLAGQHATTQSADDHHRG